jgi:hypothetical protein
MAGCRKSPSGFYWMSEFLAGVCFLIDNNNSETTWNFLFISILKKQNEGVWDMCVLKTVCLNLKKENNVGMEMIT